MDQNRSTFSTAYIGRWQSTFTNGSASHGFKKGKERSGEGKKKNDYNERLVSQKKQQQRKLKDTKEGNFKLKHFSTQQILASCKKRNQRTHILNVNFLV